MRLVIAATALTLIGIAPAQADDRAECLAGVSQLRAWVTARPAPPNLGDLQRALRRAEREAGEREFDECVKILKVGLTGPVQEEDDDDDNDDLPETESFFGATQGTDILEKGEFELSSEIGGSFGKRAGRYRVGSWENTFAFAPIQGLSVEVGATLNHHSIRGVPELDNRSSTGLGELSAEFKYQLVKRGETSPIGIAAIVEPGIAFRSEEEGEPGRGFGLETRLAADTALVPNQVFAAVNLIYELEKFRPRGRAVAERESQIGVSGSLAFQAFSNVFLGADVRYLRAYEGFGLQEFEGHAVFIGPTLYAKLSDNLSLSASFSTQIAGRSAESPGRRLDLDNFSRHQAALKISYEF